MSALELQSLRRMVAAAARLRGEAIRDVTVRSDGRHLKVELKSGAILVIAVEQDAQGRHRLAVDVVEAPREAPGQIEARFD